MQRSKIFIGTSSQKGLTIAQAIQAQLAHDGQIEIWNEDVFKPGQTTFDTLIRTIERYDFAILVFTLDDSTDIVKRTFAPRDNVIFELGLFMGRIGTSRTFVVANVASLDNLKIPSDLKGLTFAVYDYHDDPEENLASSLGPACTKIRDRIQEQGPISQKEKELGVLYRLLNACTYPFYPDIEIEFLKYVNSKTPEKFEYVSDVIEFLEDLFRDYVYPLINHKQLQALRIYFAYYLGDGIDLEDAEMPPTYCVDKDSDGKNFRGQFIVGMSNTEEFTERSWRVGRAISGYDHGRATSNCAKVFQQGVAKYKRDLQIPTQREGNYATEGELSVYSVPVEWRTHEGNVRIGVLAVSSRYPRYIPDHLRVRMQLLGNIVGFLFSLYAISNMSDLETETSRLPQGSLPQVGIEIGRNSSAEQFIRRAIALRRQIATHFEHEFLKLGSHKWNGNELIVVEPHDHKL